MIDKLEILKMKSQAANCRRIAKDHEGSVAKVLIERAQELEEMVRKWELDTIQK